MMMKTMNRRRRAKGLHRLMLMAVAAWGAHGLEPMAFAQEAPLSRLADLRAITRSEAAKRPQVRVRAVVSLLGEGITPLNQTPPALRSFCLDDESVGIWVGVSQALQEKYWQGTKEELLALREGMEIELEGVMVEGSFAPNLLPRRFRVLGMKALPPPADVPLPELMSGAVVTRRVRAAGVVQSIADEAGRRWLLKVQTESGHFLMRLPKIEAFSPAHLLDAEVRISGLAAVSRNSRAEFVCPRLIISHERDVEILKAAPADAFAAVQVPLEALDGYSPDGRPLHRRRSEGIVTLHEPGVSLVIQHNGTAVRVEPAGKDPLQVGDLVEVTGFVDNSDVVASISGALVRKVTHQSAPEPVPVSMAEILADYERLRLGKSTRRVGDYDGLLVSMTGRLLNVLSPSQDGVQQLELDCGNATTTAFLHGSRPDLRPGAELRLTGVADLQYAPAGQTANFARPLRLDLQLRDKDDIHILSMPSWWTLQRLLNALLVVGVVAVAMLAWAISLRKIVARQTRQLAQEMRGRRDSAVEFQAALRERARLAANLHDTVLQTMTGIAYQIEACETESLPEAQRPANHLETARRMVQRGQEDLRNAVWALRALPMQETTITEAVRKVAQQISAGHSVQIVVEAANELPQLAAFIGGNLLLIVQEAVHNALKHARSTRIHIHLSSDAVRQSFTLRVTDDGAGFVPGSQAGADSGHFGMEGMRERAERMSGSLDIRSQPGAGTTITVVVPLHAFDHDLA